jgi:pantoate--beta-alanine ligase
MKVLRNIGGLKKALFNIDKLGFVPTMGCIHEGHASLIKESQQSTEKTLVSIFVNPRQFNNKNDYIKYPRNLKKDLKLLKTLKVDFIFLPTANEIYNKKEKKTHLGVKDKIMCAKFRKGHFEGVLDIMKRFITIIKPQMIFMGEKDFQQVYLIKKLVKKKPKIKIISCKTIRDKNFLALSSRNFLLKKNDLIKASLISKNLFYFKKKVKNKNNLKHIIMLKKKELLNKFNIKIEYLEIRNEKNLNVYKKDKKFRIFIAYYLNKIRLIDNF